MAQIGCGPANLHALTGTLDALESDEHSSLNPSLLAFAELFKISGQWPVNTQIPLTTVHWPLITSRLTKGSHQDNAQLPSNDGTDRVTDIASNIQRIRERIASAAVAAGRSPQDITLLAVTKTFPVEAIVAAIHSGQRHFGENRVQEAEPKIGFFRGTEPLEWHLVGHLQSNKARRAVELFDVIHSVDSVKLAEKLSAEALELGKKLSVLIEVNLAGEATKFGVAREQVSELVGRVSLLPGLRPNGLMVIPPFFEDPNQARPVFKELRLLRDRLEAEHTGCLGQKQLSMGMSHDFAVAISEGATIVRIGTAIFGARDRAR